nr:diguanylate cyclase [Actinomycetota bacterium]
MAERTDQSGSHRLPIFVAANCAVAGVAIAVVASRAGWSIPAPVRPTQLALFICLLIVGELFPITIQRKGTKDLITVSGPFALALLLRWPLIFVIVAQSVASLLDGAVHRISWWARLFNVSQYIVSLASAGLLFHALASPITAANFSATHFFAALAAAAVFFVMNNTLTGIGIGLSEGLPLLRLLLDDLWFQVSTNGALIALAPILLVVADRNVLLMLLLPIPLVAIYRSATVTIEKEHQSRHDVLTGLPNRVEFEALADDAIAAAGSSAKTVAVIMVDISDFNDVNDTLGHEVGDELLKQVGTRLRGVVDSEIAVTRFGGDQFAILAPSLPTPFQATEIARSLLAAFDDSYFIDSSAFDLGASAGLAVFPQHGDDVGSLLRHAEIALEEAKKRHTGFEIYKPENNPYTWRRLALAADLRKAIASGDLTLLYQPIVDMPSGKVGSVEALVRWPHPE